LYAKETPKEVLMKKIAILTTFLLLICLPSKQHSIASEKQWEMKSTHQCDAIAHPYYHIPKDVIVGILDTGLDYNHCDLSGHLWDGGKNYPNHGYDFTSPDNDPMSGNPHGTFVAGIIAQMAPNAKIAGLQIIKDSYNPSMFTAAIKFAIKQNIKILNASIAFQDPDISSPEIRSAIQLYQDFGGLLVIAAGNDSNDNDENPKYPASYSYDCIISVAALDDSDDLAEFSNYGEKTVDIAAPGVLIEGPTTRNKRAAHSGTSASAPIVSALAAYIWGINQNLNAQEVKKIIIDNCDYLDSLDKKLISGKINFLKAFIATIGEIQSESICYKGKMMIKQNLINGWQQIVLKDMPNVHFSEKSTIIITGDQSFEKAKSVIDFWIKKNMLSKECECKK